MRLILIIFTALALHAQFTPPAGGGALNVTSDPSGSCTIGSNLQYNTSNGKLWGCNNGTWSQVGGGGGSMTWPTAAGITVCTGTPCTAWGTSLTAPAGTIVGTSDTQTLTNKTVDGATATEIGYLSGVTSAIQTQFGLKAPLASPTFTGTPAAPTPSQADNSTKLATTAYVDTGLGGKAASNASTTVNGQTCTLGSSCTIALSAINPQTATYQALAGDFSNYKTITVASGTFTITLVASGSQPAAGQYLRVINYGSGVVTIARSGQNINGGTTSLTLAAASATAPTSVTVFSDGTNYFAATAGGTSGGGGTSVTPTTFSSIPACSSTAAYYQLTDSIYNAAYCDGASALHYYYGGLEMLPMSGFTGMNYGVCSTTTTYGGSQLLCTASGSTGTAQISMQYVAYPGTPFNRTLAFQIDPWANYMGGGIGISDGTIVDGMIVQFNSGASLVGVNVLHCPTVSSCTSNPLAQTIEPNPAGGIWYFRINDTGTTRNWQISYDNRNFRTLLSESNTARLTPTRIGPVIVAQSTVNVNLWVAGWSNP